MNFNIPVHHCETKIISIQGSEQVQLTNAHIFLVSPKNVRQSCWTCSIDFGLDRKFSHSVQNHIMQGRSKRILGSGTFMITQMWILQRLKTSIMIHDNHDNSSQGLSLGPVFVLMGVFVLRKANRQAVQHTVCYIQHVT